MNIDESIKYEFFCLLGSVESCSKTGNPKNERDLYSFCEACGDYDLGIYIFTRYYKLSKTQKSILNQLMSLHRFNFDDLMCWVDNE